MRQELEAAGFTRELVLAAIDVFEARSDDSGLCPCFGSAWLRNTPLTWDDGYNACAVDLRALLDVPDTCVWWFCGIDQHNERRTLLAFLLTWLDDTP